MNDPEATALVSVFAFILLLVFCAFGFFNMGAYFARKHAIDETTISCVEKPQKCKERYEFIKLGEKLGEN